MNRNHRWDAAASSECRALGGAGMCLSEDRPDIMFSAKEVMRDASNPTAFSQRKIPDWLDATTGRIQATRPKWLQTAAMLFASARVAPPLRLDGHLIRVWCLTHALVSISSGESEFYAIVDAVIELLRL